MLDSKRCTKCLETKDVSKFYIVKTRNKIDSVCKKCSNEKSKKWLSENREKARRIVNKWVRNNPEKHRANTAKWKNENRERDSERKRKYNAEHRVENALREHNRRAKLRGSGDRITKADWQAVLDRYGNKCLCCKRVGIPLELDHVIPVSKGGEHRIENVQPLCDHCNKKKMTKTIDFRTEFA